MTFFTKFVDQKMHQFLLHVDNYNAHEIRSNKSFMTKKLTF